MRVLLWHPAALHANTLNETRNVCAALNAAKCVINKITTTTTTTTTTTNNNTTQHNHDGAAGCCNKLNTRTTRRIRNDVGPFLPPRNNHGNENGNVIEKLHKLQLNLTHTMTMHTHKHTRIQWIYYIYDLYDIILIRDT